MIYFRVWVMHLSKILIFTSNGQGVVSSWVNLIQAATQKIH